MNHEGFIVTPFRESPPGTYEWRKGQALVKHLRAIIGLVEIAQRVSICDLAPERPWVALQEWETPGGLREGRWLSDLAVVILREVPPAMTFDPVCAFHGKRASEHQCLYCCLCFRTIEPEEFHRLPDGTREDVCDECAAAEEEGRKL